MKEEQEQTITKCIFCPYFFAILCATVLGFFLYVIIKKYWKSEKEKVEVDLENPIKKEKVLFSFDSVKVAPPSRPLSR